MIQIEEQDLKEALTMALGSQGIWTPELASTMFIEIQKQALNIDDVSKKQLEEQKKIAYDKGFSDGCDHAAPSF
tara:strand:- start:2379 stop:2600 length:222 start_codon:yes stop_codon:yes gene_type:complete